MGVRGEASPPMNPAYLWGTVTLHRVMSLTFRVQVCKSQSDHVTSSAHCKTTLLLLYTVGTEGFVKTMPHKLTCFLHV